MQQLSSRFIAPAELRSARSSGVRTVARAPVTIKAFVNEPTDGLSYVKTLPGITAPTGFFDPWDFSKSPTFTVAEAKRFREAEVTHGRVAMLAALGWVVQEQFWIIVLGFIGAHEAWRIRTGWTAEGGAVLKEYRKPGDLGFDPLGYFPRNDDKAAYELQTKELNNGRLAMIAVAGFAAQEFVDPTPIWTRLTEHGLAGPNVSGYIPGSFDENAGAGITGIYNTTDGMMGTKDGVVGMMGTSGDYNKNPADIIPEAGTVLEKAGDAFNSAKLPGLPSGGELVNKASGAVGNAGDAFASAKLPGLPSGGELVNKASGAVDNAGDAFASAKLPGLPSGGELIDKASGAVDKATSAVGKALK